MSVLWLWLWLRLHFPFVTNAFWFPTEFDIVKFSREPKGFGREKAQRAKRKENEASKGKFWKRKNCKIKRGNGNFGSNPGQMMFLEDSVGNQKALVGKICLFATNAFWSPTEFDIVKLLNSVGNQKALVGKICLFATNAFWFPTEFDIVKFSREPKGFSRENKLMCY